MKKEYLHPEVKIDELVSHVKLLTASLPVYDEKITKEEILAPENDEWEF